MSESASFDQLMARLRAGDEDAAAWLFRHYTARLIALARARLDGALRPKVDPEDILQSVFKSFFLRQAEGDWDLGGWDGLWALLARITLNKCGHRIDHFRAARRDVRREIAGGAGLWEALAREPTPDAAAALTETLEGLHRDLGPRDRDILALSLQGWDVNDVMAKVGCSQRTVYRVLGWIRERLSRLDAEGAAG